MKLMLLSVIPPPLLSVVPAPLLSVVPRLPRARILRRPRPSPTRSYARGADDLTEAATVASSDLSASTASRWGGTSLA